MKTFVLIKFQLFVWMIFEIGTQIISKQFSFNIYTLIYRNWCYTKFVNDTSSDSFIDNVTLITVLQFLFIFSIPCVWANSIARDKWKAFAIAVVTMILMKGIYVFETLAVGDMHLYINENINFPKFSKFPKDFFNIKSLFKNITSKNVLFRLLIRNLLIVVWWKDPRCRIFKYYSFTVNFHSTIHVMLNYNLKKVKIVLDDISEEDSMLEPTRCPFLKLMHEVAIIVMFVRKFR